MTSVLNSVLRTHSSCQIWLNAVSVLPVTIHVF